MMGWRGLIFQLVTSFAAFGGRTWLLLCNALGTGKIEGVDLRTSFLVELRLIDLIESIIELLSQQLV
jgi:hypothetical protein